MTLNKNEYESVFGKTETETVISSPSESSNSKATSRSSSKRADAEADLAAKLEQANAMEEIHTQQTKLIKLESEWKLKEAEVKLRLEEEKTKLQRLQASKEVKVAAARVKAYNAFDNVESCNQEVDSIILPDYLKFKY
jgi:hypothetical protein